MSDPVSKVNWILRMAMWGACLIVILGLTGFAVCLLVYFS